MADETGDTKEVTCIEGYQRQIGCQFEFLTRTFRYHHNHRKGEDREEESQQPSHEEYLQQAVCIAKQQTDDVDDPYVIEDAVVHDALHIRQEIEKIEVARRHQDITVLSDTEANQRTAPA